MSEKKITCEINILESDWNKYTKNNKSGYCELMRVLPNENLECKVDDLSNNINGKFSKKQVSIYKKDLEHYNTLSKTNHLPYFMYIFNISPQLRFKKLLNSAKTPKKGSLYAAGYDLYSPIETILHPGNRSLIKTGISIDIPNNLYGRIAPRSGLAFKYGINTLAGVIDSDYTGDIGVILYNTGKEAYKINKGDKIAQIIFTKIENNFEFIEINNIKKTDRSNKGYGSTGK